MIGWLGLHAQQEQQEQGRGQQAPLAERGTLDTGAVPAGATGSDASPTQAAQATVVEVITELAAQSDTVPTGTARTGAAPSAVVPADAVSAGDAVPAGAGFHGLVRDAGGEALGGVALTLISPDGRQVGRTLSHPDGRYALPAPAGGPYVLITAADGHEPQAATVMAGAGPVAYGVRLPRAVGATGAQVRGTVRAGKAGDPLPNARLTLVDAAGNVVRTTLSDADGAYAFTDLTAGEYSLIASGYPPMASALAVEGRGTDDFHLELAHPAPQ
ncbi:MSCRAMM family protein [Streptomyces sp. HJ7]